eukprot:536836-Rhodomonas_salina.1
MGQTGSENAVGSWNTAHERGLPAIRRPCPSSQLSLHHRPSFVLGHYDLLQHGICLRRTEQIRSVPWQGSSQSCRVSTPIPQGLFRTWTDLQQSGPVTAKHPAAGWVDSDYASDPDTLKSQAVTCYVLSMNNAQVSWKAKHQDCVTLSCAPTANTRHRRARQVHPHHFDFKWSEQQAAVRTAARRRRDVFK